MGHGRFRFGFCRAGRPAAFLYFLFGSACIRLGRVLPRVPHCAGKLPDVQAAFQNLGVYNLCLALCLCAGIGARLLSGGSAYALGLSHGFLCSGLGSIIVAGCFLFATAPDKRRAAIMQASPAVLALAFLLFS